MRSYIFTAAERKAIKEYLAGKSKRSDTVIRMVLSRTRHSAPLSGDVELYMALRKSMSTP